MNPNKSFSVAVAPFLIITVLLMFTSFYLGIKRVEDDTIKVQKSGGIHDIMKRLRAMEDLPRKKYSRYVDMLEVQKPDDLTEQDLHAVEMENLARFAYNEYASCVNCIIYFHRFVEAREEVVFNGKMYYLTIETKDDPEAGNIEVYEARVWVKPTNKKEVVDFKDIKNPNV